MVRLEDVIAADLFRAEFDCLDVFFQDFLWHVCVGFFQKFAHTLSDHIISSINNQRGSYWCENYYVGCLLPIVGGLLQRLFE